ncbi:hypothetical protein BpHYR1_003271 [Brachionus plicatilis]|uniref:Tc1-like transposase DDE domain-containing protein n=1 Tax=Brachionus plicatilis TaxID=10195 RepID=A0A3M7RAG0_BRAPC|nr:hypothetical protein BpHYR1_003271 [Brachionus plicatilis]
MIFKTNYLIIMNINLVTFARSKTTALSEFQQTYFKILICILENLEKRFFRHNLFNILFKKKVILILSLKHKILYMLIQNSEQICEFDIFRCSTTHPAFHTESNLEILAKKYGHKVVFLPKFHYELNQIEGLKCYLKQHIRARTNQTFPRMMEVLAEAKENYSYFLIVLALKN